MKRTYSLKRVSLKRKVNKLKPRKKPKTKTLSKYKKELEALQKKVVIEVYGRDCFTCNQKDLQGKNCQLGHVPWPRTDLSSICKYSHEYTRIQCISCNIWKGGMGAVALQRMIDQGIDVVSLRNRSEQTKGVVFSRKLIEEKIEEYTQKLKSVDNLLKERGQVIE